MRADARARLRFHISVAWYAARVDIVFSVCLQIPIVVLTTYVVLSCVDTRSHSHEVEMHARPELFLSRVICATNKEGQTTKQQTNTKKERKGRKRKSTERKGKKRKGKIREGREKEVRGIVLKEIGNKMGRDRKERMRKDGDKGEGQDERATKEEEGKGRKKGR